MSGAIWIFAEHKDGKLKKTAFELLSAGLKLKEKAGVELEAVLVGSGVEGLAAELGHYGASKVYVCDAPVFANYSVEGYAKAVCDLVGDNGPSVLLGGATTQGKDLFPRLAAKLDTGLITECLALDIGDDGKLVATRPIYAGKCVADATIPEGTPQMVTARPNVLEVTPADSSKTAEVVKVDAAVSEGDLRAIIKEFVKGASEKVDLTEALAIVSGGRAMKEEANFKILEELADAIGPGTTVGASRAAVDSGYAGHDMQVGQTGKVVNPNLYIACGISGAIQHLAGMRTSKVIVAINKDPEAPIFQKADYGIVGDLFKVVPILTEEIKKLKAQD